MQENMSGSNQAVALILTVALTLTCTTSLARAEPQTTAAITLGAAGRATQHTFWNETVFQMGICGDVLFGRSNVSSFGFGPYCEVLTHAFDEIQFGTGAAALLPIIDGIPLVLSAGAYGRYAPVTGIEPGIAGSLFWGLRSYNHHNPYNMAGGLLAQFRYGLGASGETAIIISAQLDVVALSLPIQFIVCAIRGGSPDTRPVK
jgi:hypothetical protein